MKKKSTLAIIATAAIALTACGGASSPITGFANAFKNGDSKAMAKYVGGTYEEGDTSGSTSSDEVAKLIWDKAVKGKSVKVGDGTKTEKTENTPEAMTYKVTVEGISYLTLAAKYTASALTGKWDKDMANKQINQAEKRTWNLDLSTYNDSEKGWLLDPASASALSVALLA